MGTALARCIQSMQLTKIWLHVQGLYPEDDNDGHGSMYGSTRPILAPTRAEARPVFTREVSAERGVRLPGGSRLQGVTRVCIYLSEDTAYDVKPEPEKVHFSLQMSLYLKIQCYRCLPKHGVWILCTKFVALLINSGVLFCCAVDHAAALPSLYRKSSCVL